VILRCLKADPGGRWRSVAHLAAALREASPEISVEQERLEETATATTAVISQRQMQERARRAFATPSVPPESAPATARDSTGGDETLVGTTAFAQDDGNRESFPTRPMKPLDPAASEALVAAPAAPAQPAVPDALAGPVSWKTVPLPGAPPHPKPAAVAPAPEPAPPVRAAPPVPAKRLTSAMASVLIAVVLVALGGGLAVWLLAR
jgi:hypothetical protein